LNESNPNNLSREPSLKGKPSTIVLLIKTGCFGKKKIIFSV